MEWNFCDDIFCSSVGIGNMLYDGIGDTIRVSLTGKSINEVYAGREILMSLGLLNEGVRVISCPTCGRTKTNIYDIVDRLKEETKNIKKQAVVAVMGCAVNGPGEAKEADMGVACGDGNAVFFKRGEKIKGISAEEIIPTIMQELEKDGIK